MQFTKIFLTQYKEGRHIGTEFYVVDENWEIVSILPECKTKCFKTYCKEKFERFGRKKFKHYKYPLDLYWDAVRIREEIREQYNIQLPEKPKNYR